MLVPVYVELGMLPLRTTLQPLLLLLLGVLEQQHAAMLPLTLRRLLLLWS
jgi:hypothetical protein